METRTLEEMNGKEALDLLRGGLVLALEKVKKEGQTEYVKGMMAGINASIDVVDLMVEISPVSRKDTCTHGNMETL